MEWTSWWWSKEKQESTKKGKKKSYLFLYDNIPERRIEIILKKYIYIWKWSLVQDTSWGSLIAKKRKKEKEQNNPSIFRKRRPVIVINWSIDTDRWRTLEGLGGYGAPAYKPVVFELGFLR